MSEPINKTNQEQDPQTASEKVICALCGADDSRVLYQVRDKMLDHPTDGYMVVRCRHCGLVYVNPRPTPEAKGTFYQGGYVFDSESSSISIEHYLPVIEYLKTRRHPGKVLDIGTGNSAFLPAMRDLGWQVTGTEVDPDLVDYFGTQYGIDLFCGQLEDAGISDKSCDAVTVFGVLEHVPDPGLFVKEVFRILKDDGIFCISGFNRSVEARMLGRYWPGFDPPRHFYSFSTDTLSHLLRNAGFQIESVKYPRLCYVPYSLLWGVQRARNRITGRKGPTLVRKLPKGFNLLNRPVARLLGDTGRSSNIYLFAAKKTG